MRKAPDSKPSWILRRMKELDRKRRHRQKIAEKQKKSRARREERAKHIGTVKRYGYGKTNIGKVISDCTEELRLLSKRRKDLTQWLKKSRKKKK